MAAQIITSDLFSVRGPMPASMRRDLACRGSGVQLRDLLARHGWDTETGVAAVVATVTPGTGKIQGLRWATRGPVISGTLKMKNLFILCWR